MMDAALLVAIEDAAPGGWEGAFQLCDPLPFSEDSCREGFREEDNSIHDDFFVLVAWSAEQEPDRELRWQIAVSEGPVYNCREQCCYLFEARVNAGESR